MSVKKTIILAALFGVAALALLVFLGRGTVEAQEGSGGDSGDIESADDPPIPPRPPRTRTPFEPYQTDPGAVTYEELSATPIPHIELDPDGDISDATYQIITKETKASVGDAGTWAETRNGYAVHQRWSQYSQIQRELAELKQAEYEAGLTGNGEVGVE
jgi:hypothetical protein